MKELTTPVVLFEDHSEMLAFLFAGGTSVNRWQSLSSSRRTQSRSAEVQPWLLYLLLAPSFLKDVAREVGNWSRCPVGTGSEYQELGICSLGKECLT